MDDNCETSVADTKKLCSFQTAFVILARHCPKLLASDALCYYARHRLLVAATVSRLLEIT